jgi:uncharacterized protein YybS (DUF2232 family)
MSQNSTDDEDFLDLAEIAPEPEPVQMVQARQQVLKTLIIVETAFLASTATLIWLIAIYLYLSPLLRVFFPIPVALAYLRWGKRTAWMTALVAFLLLSILMGPPRSLQYLIPHGLLGILFGGCWRRRNSWLVSIGWGTLIATGGLLFQLVLLSLLVGENLWVYVNQQVTGVLDWIFSLLGLLVQPEIAVVQAIALLMIVADALIYVFVVHLAAWLLLERLGNDIPDPPEWVQVMLDFRDM